MFQCTAESFGRPQALQYYWLEIINSTAIPIVNATTSTLEFIAVAKDDSTFYQCAATNENGTVNSNVGRFNGKYIHYICTLYKCCYTWLFTLLQCYYYYYWCVCVYMCVCVCVCVCMCVCVCVCVHVILKHIICNKIIYVVLCHYMQESMHNTCGTHSCLPYYKIILLSYKFQWCCIFIGLYAVYRRV